MSQYTCQACSLIMQEHLSNNGWYYRCKQCNVEKEPLQAVVFSSDDHQEEDSKVLDPEAILDDKNVQLLDEKCPVCKTNYRLFLQPGNKGTRNICECDRPVCEQIPEHIATAKQVRPDISHKVKKTHFGAVIKDIDHE